MMTTEELTLSNPALALFVAGLSLGAVCALGYTRLGGLSGAGGRDERAHANADAKIGTGTGTGTRVVRSGDGRGREGRKRRRGRAKDEGEGEGGGGGEEEGVGTGRVGLGGRAREANVSGSTHVLPGAFDGIGAAAADVGSLAGTTERGVSDPEKQEERKKKKKGKGKKTRKRGKRQPRGDKGDVDADAEAEDDDDDDVDPELDPDEDGEGDELGSETGKEAVGLRSGHSADAVLEPSFSSGDALSGSRGPLGKTILAPSRREIRLSPSLDTDSSWTHVDRQRLKSKAVEDATSSDLASTASESPVVERVDDMRLARGDMAQRTLAERLVPRPGETGVEDMLEKPDVPTLARVVRVQPQAGETLVPGFSWDDYGDVVQDNVDADETEDDGEWGVVKSRHRTQPPQTTATTSTSTSQAPAAASEAMTKKQRQNARKRDLTKAAKAEAETVRLEGLVKHKRELERLRIIEQSRQGGGKRPSGGMQASVDDRGKLVWE